MHPLKSSGKKDEIAAVTADELRSQLILRKLVGKGGFAAVYLGTYKGQEVAVKVILAEHVAVDSLQVKLLLREGQYMSRCTHRNIVKCHAVVQLPANFPGIEALCHRSSTWALVLEYIGGGSMASLLMKQMQQTRKAYGDYEAYCWVRDVAEALSYLHNAPRPVMHRDVKADNVLLTVDEGGRPTAKLMDFGLMAALDGKNPMLRRRSVSRPAGQGPPGPSDSLGRGSTRSIARGSVGTSLAAPSVATYYNDSTHEPGKIFYLMDELPVATVAAITSGPASRRVSIDVTNMAAANAAAATAAAIAAANAGGGSVASPNTQFDFGAVASRGCSLDGAAGGGGIGGVLPWGSAKSGSRGGPGSALLGGHASSFGTLVPLNEEASYHGNTAGYAAMLMHQQQARLQQRRAAGQEGGKPAAGGALHSSLHGNGDSGVAGDGGGGGDVGRSAQSSSLPNSLHGTANGAGERGVPHAATGTGTDPGNSPACSGRWQGDGLASGAVRLRMVSDNPSSGGGGGGLGGDAAIAAAAGAGTGRVSRQVSGRDGALVRMSAPVSPSTRAVAEAAGDVAPDDDPDVLLRESSYVHQQQPQAQGQGQGQGQLHPAESSRALAADGRPRLQPLASQRPSSAAMGIGKVIATAKHPTDAGDADVAMTPGHEDRISATSLNLGFPPLQSHPSGAASGAFRPGSHDAVPMVDVAGARGVVVPGSSPVADGAGVGVPPGRRSRLGTAGSVGGPVSVGALGMPYRTASAPSSGVQMHLVGTPPGSAPPPASASMAATPLADGNNNVIDRQSSQKSIGSNRSGTGNGYVNGGAADGGGGGGAAAGGGGGGGHAPLSITAMLQGRYEQDFQWVWRLTGQTGSCMYMAPEVFRNMPYNEKVDVFSFGVLLYEVFSRTLLLVSAMNLRELRLKGMDTPEGYAQIVAEGYRPLRPLAMPEPLYELISACWSDDPLVRPNMADVVETLRVLQEQYAPQPTAGGAVAACGCVIS